MAPLLNFKGLKKQSKKRKRLRQVSKIAMVAILGFAFAYLCYRSSVISLMLTKVSQNNNVELTTDLNNNTQGFKRLKPWVLFIATITLIKLVSIHYSSMEVPSMEIQLDNDKNRYTITTQDIHIFPLIIGLGIPSMARLMSSGYFLTKYFAVK